MWDQGCRANVLQDGAPLRVSSYSASNESNIAVCALAVPKHALTLDTKILESCSDERSFLLDVCERFLADAPGRIQDLKSALNQENMQVLIQSAHALKSLSSCIGAMRLFKICQFIEAAGREKIDIVTSAVLEQIETEYEYLQLAVQDYKNAH